MSQDLAKVESVYAKVGRESEPSALFFFFCHICLYCEQQVGHFQQQ